MEAELFSVMVDLIWVLVFIAYTKPVIGLIKSVSYYIGKRAAEIDQSLREKGKR